MNYQKTGVLKGIARDKMLGNYSAAVGAYVFMRIILVTGLSFSLALTGSSGLIALVISFLFMLLEGILVFGELAIYLKISVGQKAVAGDLFSASKVFAEKAVKFRLIYLAILYGSLGLAIGFEYLLIKLSILNMSLLYTAWGIIAVVCIYLLLTYSQVMYYIHDFTELSVKEACNKSKELMKGNKLSLLYIYISFIPMYLVGALTMMLGIYFVHPYFKLTLTEFYLDRVRQTQIPGFDVQV